MGWMNVMHIGTSTSMQTRLWQNKIKQIFNHINFPATLESWKGIAFSCTHFFLKVQISNTIYVKEIHISMVKPETQDCINIACVGTQVLIAFSVAVILNLGVL